MKRALFLLSVVLLILCGCELSVGTEDPRIEIYIASTELEYCDGYKVTAKKGNTTIMVESMDETHMPIVLDSVSPGQWSIEVQAIVDGKVKGTADTDVYVNQKAASRINLWIKIFDDYTFDTFRETLEKAVKDNPKTEGMKTNQYLSGIAGALPHRPHYNYMDDSKLEDFRTAIRNWFLLEEIDAEIAVTKENEEFRIVIENDTKRCTLTQDSYGYWTIRYLDKTLPEDMKSYLHDLRTASIARIDADLPKVVLHDDYDRVRVLIDSLISSLDSTTAFVTHLDYDKTVVIGEFLQALIDDMKLKIQGFEDIISIDITKVDYSNVFMDVEITVIEYPETSYIYKLRLDAQGNWNIDRPELPLWKPRQENIDEAVDIAAAAFNEAFASSPAVSNPSTQTEMVSGLMEIFSSHLPDSELLPLMDENQRYRFEGTISKMISNAFAVIPGAAPLPTVTVSADTDYINFSFIVAVHLETGDSYTYRYQRDHEGNWTYSHEYDDGTRDDIPNATYDNFKGNYMRTRIEAGNEVAPGPGYYDLSMMVKDPLFWQMSERQIRQFRTDAGKNVHKVTPLQQDWVRQNFVNDARIVGNEFRWYYSIHDQISGRICQAVTIQHENGTWEERYVSEWVDLPAHDTIKLVPSYDDIRNDLEVLQSSLSQSIESDMAIYDFKYPSYNIGFLMDRLLDRLPPSDKYRIMTDAQAAMLEKDLADVVFACHGLLPDFTEKPTLNMHVGVDEYAGWIEFIFTLYGDSVYSYHIRANGNDGWSIGTPNREPLPPRCANYQDVYMRLEALENEIAGILQENAMDPAPKAESERVSHLMDIMFSRLPRFEVTYLLTSRQEVQFVTDYKNMLDRLLSKVTPVAAETVTPAFTVKLQQSRTDSIYLSVNVDIGDGNTYTYVYHHPGYGWEIERVPTFPAVN